MPTNPRRKEKSFTKFPKRAFLSSMIKLSLALLLVCVAGSVAAQSLADKAAPYGEVFIVKLDSAPFPHPDRAQGHKYHNEFLQRRKKLFEQQHGDFRAERFSPDGTVDFVVHFHGWRHHVENTFIEYNLIEQFAAERAERHPGGAAGTV